MVSRRWRLLHCVLPFLLTLQHTAQTTKIQTREFAGIAEACSLRIFFVGTYLSGHHARHSRTQQNCELCTTWQRPWKGWIASWWVRASLDSQLLVLWRLGGERCVVFSRRKHAGGMPLKFKSNDKLQTGSTRSTAMSQQHVPAKLLSLCLPR